jgi:hypothetical protein
VCHRDRWTPVGLGLMYQPTDPLCAPSTESLSLIDGPQRVSGEYHVSEAL